MKRKNYISASFLAAFLLFVNYLFAQPTQEWISLYEYSSNSSLTMCIDSSGNVFTSGNDGIAPYGFVTVKYNSGGQQIWTRRFVGGMNFIARPVSIGCDQQGNIYVAAYDESMILIKYNNLGVQQWFRRYPANYLSDMVITKHGFPIITGTVINGAPTRNDCVTVKYNHTGDTLWSAIYNSPSNNWDWSVAMDISMIGEVCITGYSGNSGNTEVDFLTVKYDSNGIQQWVRTYGNSNSWDEAKDIRFDGIGNIYVTGFLDVNDPNFCTIKYSINGLQEWVRIFHNSENIEELPRKLMIDHSNDVIITGDAIDTSYRNKILTIKYSNEGTLIWHKRYGIPNAFINSTQNCLGVDVSNNIYITGTIDYFPRNARDLVAIKYSSSGNFIWDVIYTGQDSISSGLNIIVDRNSNIHLNGHQADSTGSNFITMKYSQPIGIEPISNELPVNFILFQNYPNPFNPATNIKFSIPFSHDVKITVYDILGRELIVLVNEKLKPGEYNVSWDTSSFSSGVYFYKLEAGSFIESKKMVLVK